MDSGTDAPQKNETKRERRWSRFTDVMTTVPGVLAAVAALITAIAGVYFGLIQSHSRAGIAPAATPAITVPATDTAEPAAQSTAPSQPAGAIAPARTAYLSGLTPVQENVAAGTFATGPQQIGSVSYPHSVRFGCAGGYAIDSIVYNVAGYQSLTATVDVPTASAAGESVIIQFADNATGQILDALTVDVDKPQTVQASLQGAGQLLIDCQPVGGAGVDVVLGSAALHSSS